MDIPKIDGLKRKHKEVYRKYNKIKCSICKKNNALIHFRLPWKIYPCNECMLKIAIKEDKLVKNGTT